MDIENNQSVGQECSVDLKARMKRRGLVLVGTVLILGAVVVGVSLLMAKGDSDIPEIYRIASFDTTSEWYTECLEEALTCDFYFNGNEENVPVYDVRETEDNVGFTDSIKSRTYTNGVGGLNSNGQAASFIFDGDVEQTMNDYFSSFATYQFKPSGKDNTLMHETFQGDSRVHANGKCVKVYITSWNIKNANGDVIDNINTPAEDSCLVFRTGIVEYEDEEETCEQHAEQCEFYFQGHDSEVPIYSLANTENDVGFTDVVVARDGSTIGTMNSNGQATSFVLGGEEGEVSMIDYIPAFTTYQFKPDGGAQAKIMYETFQSQSDASGKCVKVYFTHWQVLNGDDVENVVSDSVNACAVFRTE